MHLVDVLLRHGGVASRSQLPGSARQLKKLVDSGTIVRLAPGRFALPTAADALRAATRLQGTMSHRSAATYWGWELKTQPPKPEVIVPRKRRVDPHRRHGVRLTWRDLAPGDLDGPATSPIRTVSDCALALPFDEALAVADSALRSGLVTRSDLDSLVLRGHGARQARRVLELADGRAANPFESVLRAIAVDVPRLAVTPQVELDLSGELVRPDLVDTQLRTVLEADSFAWHGHRKALMRDCRRYNRLSLHGWLVLRFSWEDVMLTPDDVAIALAEAVALRTASRRTGTNAGCGRFRT
ncbi:DUF559 domain-containing protein [Nocardioides sp. InS609-2]|uniref:DUF559 domain-containing protein n=1 Tax=Nocardioides sp. InS609-2 TaxID=2760705 RepID=UPI0020BF264E|nr:DUF559 domain-containing protein [Nocardioides sp. InS609-2]